MVRGTHGILLGSQGRGAPAGRVLEAKKRRFASCLLLRSKKATYLPNSVCVYRSSRARICWKAPKLRRVVGRDASSRDGQTESLLREPSCACHRDSSVGPHRVERGTRTPRVGVQRGVRQRVVTPVRLD